MILLPTYQAVENLLVEIKKRISEDGLIYMNSRSKNSQTLADLGLNAKEQRRVIDSLKLENYCGGPEPDDKYQGKYVAVFGKMVNGIELYIKFSIGERGTPIVCLSFHEAEGPMSYKFK
ncbi:type II toxin-antitoxin system MqsR family toxin [Niastella populi]|uniref:type II toxin-antitoxin system MqsR family toxin n=1 Tax=Niastella populi TaxID=550983 RepID=UPI0009BFC6CF|nr:type II toxin-antitoxin system MqsR family toxin [Niastella populi]